MSNNNYRLTEREYRAYQHYHGERKYTAWEIVGEVIGGIVAAIVIIGILALPL